MPDLYPKLAMGSRPLSAEEMEMLRQYRPLGARMDENGVYRQRTPEQRSVLEGLRGSSGVRSRAQQMIQSLPPMEPPGDELFRPGDISVQYEELGPANTQADRDLRDIQEHGVGSFPRGQKFDATSEEYFFPKKPVERNAYVGSFRGRG